MGVQVEKIKREIMAKISRDEEVNKGTRTMAIEVQKYIIEHTAPSPWNPSPLTKTGPYATGDYAKSIKIKQERVRSGRRFGGRYLSEYRVYSDHPNANFLEYGTGVDKPGSRSPWGPNTPTPEFAPFGRAAHHFGGTAP